MIFLFLFFKISSSILESSMWFGESTVLISETTLWFRKITLMIKICMLTFLVFRLLLEKFC